MKLEVTVTDSQQKMDRAHNHCRLSAEDRQAQVKLNAQITIRVRTTYIEKQKNVHACVRT